MNCLTMVCGDGGLGGQSRRWLPLPPSGWYTSMCRPSGETRNTSTTLSLPSPLSPRAFVNSRHTQPSSSTFTCQSNEKRMKCRFILILTWHYCSSHVLFMGWGWFCPNPARAVIKLFQLPKWFHHNGVIEMKLHQMIMS